MKSTKVEVKKVEAKAQLYAQLFSYSLSNGLCRRRLEIKIHAYIFFHCCCAPGAVGAAAAVFVVGVLLCLLFFIVNN